MAQANASTPWVITQAAEAQPDRQHRLAAQSEMTSRSRAAIRW
jgi:hypothetical protein